MSPAAAVRRLGARALPLPIAVGAATLLFGAILTRSFRRLLRRDAGDARAVVRGLCVDQLWYTAVQAALVVGVLGALVGVTLLGVGYRSLDALGSADLFGVLFQAVVTAELAPLLSAIVVAARSASAIATELLAMRLDDEVDALEVHGVDPHVVLGLPRLVGVSVGTVCLGVVFAVAAHGGCLAATVPLGLSEAAIGSELTTSLEPGHVSGLLVRGALFGLAIVGASLRRGFLAGGDRSDLPRTGARATVDALVVVFGLDALLAVLW